MDLYSRKIVGYSGFRELRVYHGWSSSLHTELCTNALAMALEQTPPLLGLLHHSDRGYQYASLVYQKLLDDHGITCSMSRKGNCYDNAVADSFFVTLNMELIHNTHSQNRDHARATIFEYIEVFYNRKRRHSAVCYATPHAYQNAYANLQIAVLIICPLNGYQFR